MVISDPEEIKKALLKWASSSTQFKEVEISDDGLEISSGSTVLDAIAKIKLAVPAKDRSCEYTTAAVFLQIRDPNQGLVSYRNACKKYAVADPVKALDKPIIVKEFLGSGSSQQQQPEAPLPPAGPPPPSSKDSSSSKRKHHDKKHHHHRGEKPSPPKKKKRPDLVTNEQLFEGLSTVVDKRHQSQQEQETSALQAEITAALSAKGFEITSKEQLEPYKERTANILANEIPVGNSASILRATNPRKDLSRVLELYMETVNAKGKKGVSSSSSSSKKAAVAPNSGKKSNSKPYLIGKKPIIIVPKGMAAPLTLINAHEFLCNAKFVPRDVMLQQQPGRKINPPTTFTRTVTGVGGLLEYEILDTPRKLGADPKEWERIVAVIVLGQSWQFKDWLKPHYNVPAELFNRVFGFYVSMEGDKEPPELTGWAVHRYKLNRDKRGLDSVTYASFWNGLDEWMRVYKAELLPQQQDG